MKCYKVAKVKEILEGAEKGILSKNLFLPNEKLVGQILPASFAVYQRAGGSFEWQGYKFSYLPEVGGWEVEKTRKRVGMPSQINN